jgi:predicted secreted hydrolase
VSIRTSLSFPTKFRLTIPSANVHLMVEAAMQEQEFISYIERLSFWKGKMNVTGTVDGFPVTGNGFLEVISLFLECVYLLSILSG